MASDRPEMGAYTADAQHAVSVRRMASFDELPKWLRQRLAQAPGMFDTAQLAVLYRQARQEIGARKARAWILASIVANERTTVGALRPLHKPPPRRRPGSPPTHRLAPAVPEMAPL